MKKKIVIGLLLIFVTGCSMYKQNIIYELLDEGTINFKSMNEKEKNEIYEELDEVTKLEDTEKKPPIIRHLFILIAWTTIIL